MGVGVGGGVGKGVGMGVGVGVGVGMRIGSHGAPGDVKDLVLLPTGSEERGVSGVGSIPACCNTSLLSILHYNCINMNLVG